MPNASNAARPLSEETPKTTESIERASAPERVETAVEKALESGSTENVINIFKGRAEEEKQALERLGVLEPEEAEAVPEQASRVTELTEQARRKIDQAATTALEEVKSLLGTPPAPAKEVAPVTETPKAEAIPVETVKTMPVVAVGEAPKAEVATVEAVSVMPTVKIGEVVPEAETSAVDVTEVSPEQADAEEQRDVAAEVIRENAEALSAFAKEHGLTMNEQAFTIAESDLAKLTKPERMYAQVLMGKREAGRASMLHAEKLLAAHEFPDGDPKRAELMREAEALAADASLKETAAQVMQQNYMNLPEIIALAGGGGNESGGSYGGSGFEAQTSPFGGEPKQPTGSSVGGLYDGGGQPGSGLTEIKAYKTPPEKVEKRKPNFIERFFNKNWRDMTYGSGGDGGSRE